MPYGNRYPLIAKQIIYKGMHFTIPTDQIKQRVILHAGNNVLSNIDDFVGGGQTTDCESIIVQFSIYS
jgi:hypothetical protein